MDKSTCFYVFPKSSLTILWTGLLAAFLSFASPGAIAGGGMVNLESPHTVAVTIDRLSAILENKGMQIFARVNHAQGAESAGISLRPTELLIFGNPKVGSPLMVCAQSVAIDLPQKAVAWEDAEGQVWLSYNDPDYLDQRHSIGECGGVPAKVKGALGNFAAAATSDG